MHIINQSYQIIGTPKSVEEAWQFAAEASRNCYQSSKTKLDESEEDFCKRILLKGQDFTVMSRKEMEKLHLSPLEFGIIYLDIPDVYTYDRYTVNPYSRTVHDFKGNHLYVTTNLRVLIENHWEEDLQYACAPTKHHVLACCFKLDTCLHVYKDLTRHRPLSYAIESTRFCNYIKSKFGVSIKFVKFPWVKPEEEDEVAKDLETIESIYFKWINKGWQAQQAAEFLPQAVKGTVYLCGYTDNLEHMFNLRANECSGPVHPLVAEVMKPMYKSYKEWLTTLFN